MSYPNDPTPDELDHTPLTFGKYKGSTPDEVAEEDPQYLVWAYENVLNRPHFMSELLYQECLKVKRTPRSFVPTKADSYFDSPNPDD